ncbi:imelysin family protein [Methylobrevis pamukkalensis]|uniref:Imelysin n=1 Tax=Methylobrevis pamukkalensis TaxID=1439726 RepID=A0A1E3H8Q6_9HYPH|nr:imelysin family protein [Methylobrevis pamukkalensis]ODN71881.1 Imelysin [Methylobrevis pamukkalensis]
MGACLGRFGQLVAATTMALSLAATLAMAPARAQEGATAASSAFGETDFAMMVRTTIERQIRPAFTIFSERAARLSISTSMLCAAPDAAALAAVREDFGTAVLAWSAVEFLRVGPMMDDHRLERLAFWPDPRGIGLRQVQAALASGDETAADPAALTQKSVAMQGLTALDYLLFGTAADDLAAPGAADYRCRYARAVAQNVSAMAEELENDWNRGEDGIAALFEQPGPDNPLFQTSKEAAGEIFQQVATGLEIVADHKLKTALGKSAATAKPKLAPFWRSGATLPTIRANLEGLSALVEASGALDRLGKSDRWLADAIRFEFRNAIDAARGSTRRSRMWCGTRRCAIWPAT